MRSAPNSDNAAAVRVHEQGEERVSRNPNPLRSEIVDMQVRDAWRREHEIDATRSEKIGGLGEAVLTPVSAVPPVQPAEPLSDDPMDDLNALLQNARTDE